jgi:hypothetical protein
MALKQETHDIWGTSLFWGTIRLRKGTELYHAYPTHEIDPPYRWAVSHIIRVPLTSVGFTFGRWHTATRSEEEAILAGLAGRVVEDSQEQENVKQRAREIVAMNSNSLDEEWAITDILGLNENVLVTKNT